MYDPYLHDYGSTGSKYIVSCLIISMAWLYEYDPDLHNYGSTGSKYIVKHCLCLCLCLCLSLCLSMSLSLCLSLSLSLSVWAQTHKKQKTDDFVFLPSSPRRASTSL
jgi:hypothetical protein